MHIGQLSVQSFDNHYVSSMFLIASMYIYFNTSTCVLHGFVKEKEMWFVKVHNKKTGGVAFHKTKRGNV